MDLAAHLEKECCLVWQSRGAPAGASSNPVLTKQTKQVKLRLISRQLDNVSPGRPCYMRRRTFDAVLGSNVNVLGSV